MALSIKVSELNVLDQITSDDYIIVNDSGSVTTGRAPVNILTDFLSGSNKYVGSASYSKYSEYSRLSLSSSYASASTFSSYASSSFTSSYASASLSASYSISSSYASRASIADSVVGGSGFATLSTSSSYSSASLSASYSSSGSYALTSSFTNRAFTSSYSVSSSLSDYTKEVFINGGIPLTGKFFNPLYSYLATWSGSYTGKLQRTNFLDLGIQYNVGKPLVFGKLIDSQIETSTNLTPLVQPYAELREGNNAYAPWIVMSYVYTSGSGGAYTGSWPGWRDPNILPPGTNGEGRNLRVIPKTPNIGETNYLDETGFGAQTWTLYSRTSRNFAWYRGGSSFGHSDKEMDAGISGSTVMALVGARLGIGNFVSHSVTANPSALMFTYPQAPLHISASEDALTNTSVPLVRLDQGVGSAGSIGSLQGWITINVAGVNYKLPLYG